MDLESALDAVFAAPLDRFTAERNRIAKELGDAGDEGAAAVVKPLKKPSVSAWAINQVARSHREDVVAFVGSHDELVEAADASALRRVQEQRKRAIAALTEEAARVLEEAGHSAASGTMQRVSQSLLAASSEHELDSLRKGRLTRDLESSGFGAVVGFDLAAESAPFEKSDRKARDRAEELGRLAAELEREGGRARLEADEAADAARGLAREADRAEKRAQAARAKADSALERLS